MTSGAFQNQPLPQIALPIQKFGENLSNSDDSFKWPEKLQKINQVSLENSVSIIMERNC